jgi:hypothetical protein
MPDYFPPYASGGGYVLTADLVKIVALPPVEPVLMTNEDAYLGIVMLPFNVKRVHQEEVWPHGLRGGCRDGAGIKSIHYVKASKSDYGCMAEINTNISKGLQVCTVIGLFLFCFVFVFISKGLQAYGERIVFGFVFFALFCFCFYIERVASVYGDRISHSCFVVPNPTPNPNPHRTLLVVNDDIGIHNVVGVEARSCVQCNSITLNSVTHR